MQNILVLIFTINISFSIIRPSKRDTQSRCSLIIYLTESQCITVLSGR
nr:MAG TPA: hypothetical protein [Caudoviricetes sp.]